jgi:hypothetical protein
VTIETECNYFFNTLTLIMVMPVLMLFQYHLTLATWSLLDAIGADKVVKRYLDRS